MKGGVDIKGFNWTSPVNFTGADDYGVFRFNNNIQAGGAGHPFANFLLGIPTDVDQTASGPNVDGVATHYGFFVQDEWRASNSVTVSLGLRYELRPPFEDREENISNFLRDTAERRRRRAVGGVHRSDRAGIRRVDRQRTDSGGRRDRLSQGLALHRQEQLRASPRPGMAPECGQSHRRSAAAMGSTTRASSARSSIRSPASTPPTT